MELTRLGESCQTFDRYMMDDLDGCLIDRIRAMVQEGLKLRVTFDNLTTFSHHLHWITQFFTFDRVSSKGLNDTVPIIQDIEEFDYIN